jgi:hypothetical protein
MLLALLPFLATFCPFMNQKRFIIRALVIIAVIWVAVFAVRTWAAQRKITAEALQKAVERSQFSDWSTQSGSNSDAERREQKIREIAAITNRLDFREREKNRENRTLEGLYRNLSADERNLFIELTVAESMSQFMIALDKMSPTERKSFVKRGLEEIAEGRTEEDLERTRELGADVIEKVTQEGMKAYFQKASADTKMDLAPLMEAMNDIMQGMRGNKFGPPQ